MSNIPPLDDLPPPAIVLRAAEEAPAQRILDDYTDAIHALRDKNYTFREIATWLNDKFGFEVDHNTVYRAYAKTVSEFRAINEAEHDDVVERDEAVNEAELNGTIVASSSAPVPSPEKPSTPKAVKTLAKKAKGKRK